MNHLSAERIEILIDPDSLEYSLELSHVSMNTLVTVLEDILDMITDPNRSKEGLTFMDEDGQTIDPDDIEVFNKEDD